MDGRYLAQQFLNQTFHLEFEDVLIDENGERRSNYCIRALNNETRSFQVLYGYLFYL